MNIFKTTKKDNIGKGYIGNKWFLYGPSKSIALKYNPRGYESWSQIHISLFGKELILKLPFRINFLEPEVYNEFGINYTGFYTWDGFNIFSWKGITRYFNSFYKADTLIETSYSTHDDSLSTNREEAQSIKMPFLNKANNVIYYPHVRIKRLTWANKYIPIFKKYEIELEVEFDEQPGNKRKNYKGSCIVNFKQLKNENGSDCWDRFLEETNFV